MAVSVIKATSKCHIRTSKPISVAVAANAKGTVNYGYNEPAPNGTLVSKEFVRTDSGGYSIIIDAPLYGSYIAYMSLGSSPTLEGYVRDLYVE